MAPRLSANTERRLVWETEIPTHDKRLSPLFYFQNCECRFEIFNQCINGYKLHMVSTSRQKLPQRFTFTSYIDNGNNPLKFSTRRIPPLTSVITIFDEGFSMNFDYKSRGRMKIVVIFHDEVGLTLRLTSENEKCRHVAVGTNNESGTTSSSRGHSTLDILSSDFSKLLVDDLYQDVEIQCEDHTFKAHKSVLSARSKVFLAMLQSDMIEGQTAKIKVKDMKLDVCNMLLHYMYSGKLLELTPEIARGLYEAADRYNVNGLMEPCAEFLTRYLTTDNACEMLILADTHSDQRFKECVIEYIVNEDIPLEGDSWQEFCLKQSLLATEVLNRWYSLHKKQKVN